MKRGTTEHPKFLDLCARLDLAAWEAVGILEALWLFTAKFTPQGNVGKYTNAAIAKALQWKRDPDSLVENLIEAGWIDRHPEHRAIIHDWHEHADQTVKRCLSKRGLTFICNTASTMLAQGTNSASTEKISASTMLAHRSEVDSQPLPLPLPLPMSLPEPTVHSTESFDRFWRLYELTGKPLNETDKMAAATAWVELDCEGAAEGIFACMDSERVNWKDLMRNHEYARIPFPANWLRKRPWTRTQRGRTVFA